MTQEKSTLPGEIYSYATGLDAVGQEGHLHAACLRHIAAYDFDGRVIADASEDGALAKRVVATTLQNPLTLPHYNWHIKPATIKFNGRELPAPLRVAPKEGTIVWLVSLGMAFHREWKRPEIYEDDWIAAGRLHLTEAAAREWVDALGELMRGKL